MLPPVYSMTTSPVENDLFFGLPNEFLRLDDDQEQRTLELLLETAVDWAEMWTGRTLRLTSFTAQFSCFEFGGYGSYDTRPHLILAKSPVIDVAAVRVRVTGDPAPQEQAGFVLARAERNSAVFLQKGVETPDVDPDVDYPIEVDFRAGYTHENPVSPEILLPSSVRTGIQQHVAFMFENRGDVKDEEDGVPMVVKRSYSKIKLLRTAGD